MPGYREEPEVDPESETETFVAARFEIDDWRWAGVPFYLRTGKRLPKRSSEIAIQFRPVPHRLFKDSSVDPEPNLLALRIQPDEGILLRFGAKVPGLGLDVRAVNMDFTYGSAFNVDSPDAYETLILDALLGDASLFTRADEVEEAWSIVTPIIDAWLDMPAPGVPELRGRLVGPGGGRRADGPGRPTLAADLTTDLHRSEPRPASRRCAGRRGRRTIDGIERELAKIWASPTLTGDGRTSAEGRHVAARTSVMNLVVSPAGPRSASTAPRSSRSSPAATRRGR